MWSIKVLTIKVWQVLGLTHLLFVKKFGDGKLVWPTNLVENCSITTLAFRNKKLPISYYMYY